MEVNIRTDAQRTIRLHALPLFEMPISIRSAVAGTIKHEHAHLLEQLNKARDLCSQPYDRGREANNFLRDLLTYLYDHFVNEEAAMRKPIGLELNHEFREHMEAHAELMASVVQAISQEPLGQRLADVSSLILHGLDEHIRTHDARLLSRLDGHS